MATVYSSPVVRKILRAAMTRRVSLALVTDSNGRRSDSGFATGHSVGNARAIDDIFGVWSSGVLPGRTSSVGMFNSTRNGFQGGLGDSLGWGSKLNHPSHLADKAFPGFTNWCTKFTASSRVGGSFSVSEMIGMRHQGNSFTYTHATRRLTLVGWCAGTVMQGAQVYVVSGTGCTPGWYTVEAGTSNYYTLAGAGLGAGADGSANIQVDSARYTIVSDDGTTVVAKYQGGYPLWSGNPFTFTNNGGTKTATLVEVVATGTMATASIFTHYFNGEFAYTADGNIPYNSNALGGSIDAYLMDTGVSQDRRVLPIEDPCDWYLIYPTFSTGSGAMFPGVRRLISPYTSISPTHTTTVLAYTNTTAFRPGETVTQGGGGGKVGTFVREQGGAIYLATVAGFTGWSAGTQSFTGAVSGAVRSCPSPSLRTISTNTGEDSLMAVNIPLQAGLKFKDGYFWGLTQINDVTNGGAVGPVGALYSKFVNTLRTTGLDQSETWSMGTQSLREFVGQLFDTTQAQWSAYFDAITLGQSGNPDIGQFNQGLGVTTSAQRAAAMLIVQVSLGQNDATVESRKALDSNGSATADDSNTQAGHATNWTTLAGFIRAKWLAWGGAGDNFGIIAGGMIPSPNADSTYTSAFEPALQSVAAAVPYFCYVKASALVATADMRSRGWYGSTASYSTSETYVEDPNHVSASGADGFARLVWNALALDSGVRTDGSLLSRGGRFGRFGRL